jgi:hypothetical protein
VADIDICPGCELLEMERDNVPPEVKGAKIYLRRNDPGLEPNLVFGERLNEENLQVESKGFLSD